ncbi:SRPBCC family protein [Aquiflexum sp.]|uniref:SRPBCC family protein n=1 Tax=Aquiflexum sp. TaxID=1872584 RepID=UPI003593B4BA
MKKTISTIHTINAPSKKVWANISKATGVNEWLPVITACHFDGDKRICVTKKGEMNETILKIDNENHEFQYSIDSQPLLPIEDVVGTMKVKENSGQTILQWDLEFNLNDESLFEMVKQAVQGMYEAGAVGLETISNQ